LQSPSWPRAKEALEDGEATFVPHLGQNARDEVGEDKALKKRLQALGEVRGLAKGPCMFFVSKDCKLSV